MRSSDIKKKKKDEEIYEEVGEEVFGTDTYQSSFSTFVFSLSDKFNAFRRTKMFIPVMSLVIFVVFFLIVVLSFSLGGSDSKTSITGVTIKVPKIIYLEDSANFSINVYGTGNLEETNLKFSITNEKVAELKEKELIGSSATNTITAKSLGTFYIFVNYQNGRIKDKIQSEKIAVCERLTAELFESNEIVVSKNETKRIRFTTDSPDVCYENIKYEIEDTTIAAMSTNDKILGIKKGTTKLIVTSGAQKIELTVRVDE